MSCWNGLGVNYKSVDPSVIAQDVAYFNSIGVHYIRPHIPSHDNDSDISEWKAVAKAFHDSGFYVEWGVSLSYPDGVTSATWNAYATGVKAAALVCQNENICDEFGLGNEIELHHDESISDATIRSNLRTLATEVQAIYTIGPVSYQVSQGASLTGWINDNDLGNLDLLGLNTYGVWTNSRYINRAYQSSISSAYTAFGEKLYLSEFNLDYDNTRFQSIPENIALTETRIMQKYIKDSGITRAQLYQWRGWKDTTDSDFNLKMINGDYKLAWNALANNNGRQFFINT